MTKEERQQKLKARKELYYSLEWDLRGISDKLRNLKNHKGHSPAFKVLTSAVDVMLDQVRKDYSRYENRIIQANCRDDVEAMQKALNREKAKNAKLEKEIDQAKTSSGLFVDFVRKKLGV